MSKVKIFNDPVYGFISIPHGILLKLIDHPYFQRLRRIKQLGLSHYIYPGAVHTRFHHALGAVHLMQEALITLKQKGIGITEEEEQATLIAILLHDIGHGPFSHVLEHALMDVHHEDVTQHMMSQINAEFDGALDMAIEIFEGSYPKTFLHQLVSSQLDMDRMDYLSRDSFFTGVAEGIIGYDRIIKMLDVDQNTLVIEERGMYSVEKFLLARKLMYLQVYYHKTSISTEFMLTHLLARIKSEQIWKQMSGVSTAFRYFMEHNIRVQDLIGNPKETLLHFSALDDTDIAMVIKESVYVDDKLCKFLGQGLINRKLLKIQIGKSAFSQDHLDTCLVEAKHAGIDNDIAKALIYQGNFSIDAYHCDASEIKIKKKDGSVVNLSAIIDLGSIAQQPVFHYVTKFV